MFRIVYVCYKRIVGDIMNKNKMSELEEKLMLWDKRDLVKLILDLKREIEENTNFIEDELGL